MSAKSALNVSSDVISPNRMQNCSNVTLFIVGGTGIASGAVQIESSHLGTYAGTWHPEGAAVTVVADTTKAVKVTGVGAFLRARISTVLAGGTVDVWAVGGN